MGEGLEITTFLIVSTLVMFIFALSVILFLVYYQKKISGAELRNEQLKNAFQKELLDNTIETQEHERQRIASDLHDEIGASLSASRLFLSNILMQQDIPPKLRESVLETEELINSTVESVVKIATNLMPKAIELGLPQALAELTRKLALAAGGKISFQCTGKQVPLDRSTELALYRIAQEAVNNALKHAGASCILLSLAYHTDYLLLSIEDDGRGINAEILKNTNEGGGFGLKNMISRSNMINATYSFTNLTPRGFAVEISLPYL